MRFVTIHIIHTAALLFKSRARRVQIKKHKRKRRNHKKNKKQKSLHTYVLRSMQTRRTRRKCRLKHKRKKPQQQQKQKPTFINYTQTKEQARRRSNHLVWPDVNHDALTPPAKPAAGPRHTTDGCPFAEPLLLPLVVAHVETYMYIHTYMPVRGWFVAM